MAILFFCVHPLEPLAEFIFKMKDLNSSVFRSSASAWAELSVFYQSSGEMVLERWLLALFNPYKQQSLRADERALTLSE